MSPTFATVRGRHPGPARLPAGRRPQPAGESPTPAGAAPRLPHSPELRSPLRRVVVLRSRCAPWRPRRAARGNAHCAKVPDPRGRAARLQSAPAIWIQSSPSPAKPGLPFALHRVPDTFASGSPPRGVFFQYQKTVAQISHPASSNSVPEPTVRVGKAGPI